MSNKFYIVTKGFYVDEVKILKASSDRNKLERYIEAVRKRNPDDVDELDIVEVDEYDDSYIKIMPENPIYQFHYSKNTNRFITTKPLKLSFDEEAYFIAKNGECKCIPKYPTSIILVYVRAKDEKEAFQKAQKSIAEYFKSKGMN